MNEQIIIGENLRNLREKLGWRQEDIAKYLGIDRVLVSYYENAQRDISFENLEKLAIFYGVETAELLEDIPQMQKTTMVFAFRAESYSATDLQQIAKFKKIVTNYIKVNEMCGDNGI